ncbi:hypothetical protein DDB_G0291744 [Dictyostelium discoideum AX4]|uniref:Uncharacterized protein n=1 Tax=Dictyostelium discoideum TaxID=44689 RepID=Q54E89_DICDI|nr:hypothetical protein DDB_G0291744 [Dictyostelium discoideum AX4]EAL61568.1 hypothetical protein DDB_G0291744 [Dictyostelium discoideum AX4]|eukprot:XP_629973.1 hypothetical protein DDB_G0291744 [Dictyostelium discoideum AX4]
MKVLPSNLQYVLKYSSIEFIKEFIKIQIQQYGKIEKVEPFIGNKTLISLILKNREESREQLLEFFLFNSGLYDSKCNDEKNSFSFGKIYDFENYNLLNKIYDLSIFTNRLFVTKPFNLTINQSFDELLFTHRTNLIHVLNKPIKPLDSKLDKINNKIKKISSNSSGSSGSSSGSKSGSSGSSCDIEKYKLKKLQKFIIIETKQIELYKDYILKYNESIDEFHQCKDELDEFYYGDHYLNAFKDNKDEFKDKNDGSDESYLISFLRYIKLSKPSISIPFIINFYNEYKKKMNLKKFHMFPILKYIKNNNNNQNLEKQQSYSLIISDKLIINWLISFENKVILSVLLNDHSIVFTDFQIIQYAYNFNNNNSNNNNNNNNDSKEVTGQLNSFKSIQSFYLKGKENSIQVEQQSKEYIFRYLFKKSIQQCDLNNLKIIDSLNIKVLDFQSNDNDNDNDDDDFILPNTPIKQIIKLLNYLNQSKFKSFTNENLKRFYNQLVRYYKSSQSSSSSATEAAFLEFKIEENFKIKEIQEIIVNSIFKLDLIQLQFLLNNCCKKVKFDSNIFDDLVESYNPSINTKAIIFKHGYGANRIIYHYGDDDSNNGNGDGKVATDITAMITLIKSFYDRFKEYVPFSNGINIMIQHLYRKLIQHKGFTIEMMESVHQYINNGNTGYPSWFSEPGLYETFYFLHIRSPKFTKYILSFPHETTIPYSRFYDCNKQYSNIQTPPVTLNNNNNNNSISYQIRNYLLPNIFSFEFIFGRNCSCGSFKNSFGDLLKSLVNNLLFKYAEELISVSYSNLISLDTATNLKFFESIKRPTLFVELCNQYFKDNNDSIIYDYFLSGVKNRF